MASASGSGGKSFMYVCRRAPFGTVYGLEMVETVLASSAFEQRLCVVFTDDGVFQLKTHQQPAALGFKNYVKTLKALPDFGVEEIYVEMEALEARGLAADDLIRITGEDGSDCIRVVSAAQLSALIAVQNVIVEL